MSLVRRLTGSLGVALLTAASASAQALAPQTPAAEGDDANAVVERVDVVQNQFIPKETLLFYVSTKAGDRYDERRLRGDFRRLWDTGFLDDLSLDVRVGRTASSRVVLFVVKERKRIQIVDYRGSKALTTSNIEDKLKEKDAAVKIDTFYDPAKARRVEQLILDMLHEKGRPFGTVKHDTKTIGGAGLQLSFIIDDGPNTKVKEIDFSGNHVFSDSALRAAMKKIKPAGFWNLSWLGGKSTYSEEKWGEDQEKIQDFFLDHGYVSATIGQPKLTYTDGRSGFIKKGPVKWLTMEIPVSEGDQYKVGDIKFEGLTVFKEEFVRQFFKLKPGDVYNDSKLKKGYEKLRDIYGSVGYFQWTGFTKRSPDAAKKVVDLTLTMDEDKRYYVGRILFTGNDSTRDKVIRREVYMNEGDVFNTEALKLSIRRINQLGYFKPIEGAPSLQPSNLGDDKLDVTFKVEEQNRNQFTFGGGVSGLEGTFVNASFSTSNFLGLGETFQVSAQDGARTKNYVLAVTEPYFLDRPITAGFNLFKSKIDYLTAIDVVGYSQASKGITLIFGGRRGFNNLFANYSFQIYDITNVQAPTTTSSSTATVTPTSVTSTTVAPSSAIISPFFAGGVEQTYRESKIAPSFVHNTVDNPYTPRSGVKFTIATPVAGGPLGGTLNYVQPDIEAIAYKPHTRRTAFGLRAQAGWIYSYGETAKTDPKTGFNSLPFPQRIALGGENQIRGYDIRSVGPTQLINGQLVNVGGTKFVLFNAEYYIDIAGPLRGVLFYDAGQAYGEREGIDLGRLRTSTGVEIRFIMPVLNVPFRLIYAFNPNRDTFQPPSAFKFAIGTTF